MARKKGKKKGKQKQKSTVVASTFIDAFKTLQNNSSNVTSKDELSVPKELNSDRSTPGEFKGNKQNRRGTFTYPSGDVYEGEWQDGKRNGQGTLTYLDGGTYVGEWQDDKQSGRGIRTWEVGARYVGEYKHGQRNGQGSHNFPTGKNYVGEWLDGQVLDTERTNRWKSHEQEYVRLKQRLLNLRQNNS